MGNIAARNFLADLRDSRNCYLPYCQVEFKELTLVLQVFYSYPTLSIPTRLPQQYHMRPQQCGEVWE